MTERVIEVSRDGRVACVTIRRAERRNAVTPAMMHELIEASRALADDEESRAVIFRAEGGDFSVGADLTQQRGSSGKPPSLVMRRRGAELGAALMHAILEIHQPQCRASRPAPALASPPRAISVWPPTTRAWATAR